MPLPTPPSRIIVYSRAEYTINSGGSRNGVQSHHGNAAGAIAAGILDEDDLQEFGDYLVNGLKGPSATDNLMIFLSSGIGVQDLQIVTAVSVSREK